MTASWPTRVPPQLSNGLRARFPHAGGRVPPAVAPAIVDPGLRGVPPGPLPTCGDPDDSSFRRPAPPALRRLRLGRCRHLRGSRSQRLCSDRRVCWYRGAAARTGLFVPEEDRLFVAARAKAARMRRSWSIAPPRGGLGPRPGEAPARSSPPPSTAPGRTSLVETMCRPASRPPAPVAPEGVAPWEKVLGTMRLSFPTGLRFTKAHDRLPGVF